MSVLEIIVFTVVKIVLILTVMLLMVSYLVYFERRVSAWVQNRLGPNRVGWEGVLQPFADVFKLLLKEDIVPVKANQFIYVLALTSVGVYAITLAGWSSGSKYSLFGGIRSSAQMISYEISMGFSVAGVILFAESLRPLAIVNAQGSWMWNAWMQPIGFITFVVSAFAETNRLPFDLPEAEPELVGGYPTEYSSMKFAAFFLAEYANIIIAAGMIVTLYIGGR